MNERLAKLEEAIHAAVPPEYLKLQETYHQAVHEALEREKRAFHEEFQLRLRRVTFFGDRDPEEAGFEVLAEMEGFRQELAAEVKALLEQLDQEFRRKTQKLVEAERE